MDGKQYSIDIAGCMTDPQTQLSDALASKSLKDFRIALGMGAEPARMDDKHCSVYEKALKTYGCAEFVEECLKQSCSPNYINLHSKKAAINYAADSKDPQIVAALLRYKGVMVDRKYAELTPLNYLAKNITNENFNDVAACLRLLVHYGAFPNIPDQREMTPLHYIVKNRKIDELKKRELIQLFLDLPQIDIDTYRNGELRSILKQEYPDMPLRMTTRSTNVVDMECLLSHIRSGNMEKFQEQFPEYELNTSDKDNLRNTSKEQNIPLLIEAIMHGANVAFDMLMKNEVDYNAVHNGNNALEVATVCGNWYALQRLLEKTDLKQRREDQPLITIIRKFNEEPVYDSFDYRKCFYVLLESDKTDVNEMDASGSTPLHYAVKYRNAEVIKELLKRGAYIGVRSKFNDLPIDGMSPELLEEHFDDCISSNNLKLGDDNLEILINYMNLMPHNELMKSNKRLPMQSLRDEMAPITFIAKSKEHKHLLQHPLISSFLFLKWHRLSVIFYINFLLYLFFAVSIIVHTLLKFRESEYEAVTALFGIFSWIGIIYMILRECLQLIMSPVNFFCSITNYMEVALIILSIITCSSPSYDKETQRVVAVFTILLIAVELCLLVGSLPVQSISTHMLMLETVCRSFMKSFALYSIFVITFSLCFYILFGKLDQNGKPVGDGNAGDAGDAAADGGEFNKFTNPLAAVIKTIVMLTGEFDAGDIEFDSLYSYLLFLLFVFLMTIVLFNLLNGLAVSDTQAIKDQAELNGAICRTNLLSRYEEVLTGRSDRSGFIVNHEPFRTICRRLMNLYPNYIAGRQIAIMPNNNNKVFIPIANSYEMREIKRSKDTFLPLSDHDNDKQNKLLDSPVDFLPCCCSCITGKCSEMDKRTVKLALSVLEQKSQTLRAQIRMQSTERRLQSIEDKLEKMFEMLQDIQAK